VELFIDDKDERRLDLWFTVLDLIHGFVGPMHKTNEFELQAYGMVFRERIWLVFLS